MGCSLKCIAITVLLFSIGIGYLYNKLFSYSPKPHITTEWWGPGKESIDDGKPTPFKINVSEEMLEDLKARLQVFPSLPPPLEGANFRYGFSSAYLKEVAEFWLNKYDWRQREVYLNKFPQFKVKVQGLNIHYLHVKPKIPPSSTIKVVPILLLHGWPGSVREFYELIPELTTPRKGEKFVFEVIAPSLPGYGFSDPAVRPGLGPAQIAVLFGNFMKKIGFDKYYVQGGDWGSLIGSIMATLLENNVIGYHSNFCGPLSAPSQLKLVAASVWPTLFFDKEEVDRTYPLSDKFLLMMEEMGYAHIQASKPDTVGVALMDSPIGLAAYIIEKFSTWTEKDWRNLPDGGLTKKYSLQDLLDNVMIYWVSGSITTSMRLYSEFFRIDNVKLDLDNVPTKVPVACAVFPNELLFFPESLVRSKFHNLISFNVMERGGHFAAFEEPKLLADDMWSSIKKIEEVRKI